MLKYDSVLPICTKPREDRCEADSIVYGISILQMMLLKVLSAGSLYAFHCRKCSEMQFLGMLTPALRGRAFKKVFSFKASACQRIYPFSRKIPGTTTRASTVTLLIDHRKDLIDRLILIPVFSFRHIQKDAQDLQTFLFVTIGKKTVGTNLAEALGKDMEQIPPHEFLRGKSHFFNGISIAVIFVAKCD